MEEWGADAKEVFRHPKEKEWLDDDGDCRLTLEQCDCDPSQYKYGCLRCEKAIDYHIKNLVENRVPIPTRREKAPSSVADMWVNPTDAVGVVMSTTYEAIEGLWWFKHLKKIPPMSWKMIVQKYECPYAFALMELEGGKRPREVLWAPDLRLVLKFANYYYLIAASSPDTIDEIKRKYGEYVAPPQKKVTNNGAENNVRKYPPRPQGRA